MQTARNLMRRDVISVTPETSINEALDVLVENNLSGLPVVNSAGQVVGVLSEVDQIQRGTIQDRSVQQLMTRQVATVDIDAPVLDVVGAFRDNSIRRLPVTEDGVLVGIIGIRDLVGWIRETERVLTAISSDFGESDHLEATLFESECWCNAD
jgi:CBS domain-containing protein